MEKKLGYIEYKKNNNCFILKKIWNKLFFNIEIQIIDKYRYYFLINKNKISNYLLIKLRRFLKKNQINSLIISSNININKDYFQIENINFLDGKIIMKNLTIQIIKYILECQNKDFRFENIYIVTSKDNEKDFILDLAYNFKSINIVTDKIRSLKRLEKKLDEDEEIIFSLSNNTKKSLKQAKIIVNLDYDNSFFNKFNVNRNAIIINLPSKKLDMKNSYQGLIIENICIKYNKKEKIDIVDEHNFNNTILYESYICNLDYYEIKQRIMIDECKICSLIGSNGKISKEVIKKLQ